MSGIEHKALAGVLHVSLEPKQGRIFLSDLAAEKNELGLEDLDTCIWESMRLLRKNEPVFVYLFACYDRAVKALRTGNRHHQQTIEQIQVALASHAVVCTISDPSEVLYGNLARHIMDNDNSLNWSFIEAMIISAREQDLLTEFVENIMSYFCRVLNSESIRGPYIHVFNATDRLLSNSAVAQVLHTLPSFNVSGDVHAIKSTILGSYFGVSSLDPQYMSSMLHNIANMTPTEITKIVVNLQPEATLVADRLFSITDRLVRVSAASRQAVLNFFVAVLDRNHKRTATQVDPRQVSKDGLMVNMTYVAVKLCLPFMDFGGSRINKINPEYFRFKEAYSVSDETKLVADKPQADAYLAQNLSEAPNFVTQIFFIAAGFLHYGFAALFESEKRLRRHRDYLQTQLEQMSSSQATPAIDYHRRRLEAQLAAFKGMAVELGIILRNEQMVSMFYSFGAFMLIFLVNRAEPSHKYPAIKLDFNASGESWQPEESYKCFPEYLLESAADVLLYAGRNLPNIVRDNLRPEIVEVSVFFLMRPQYVHNPYLKSKLAEGLCYGAMDIPLSNGSSIPGYYMEIYNTSRVCLDHLFPALMKLYVDIEQTGRSSQFYDKFNTREVITIIMKHLWRNPQYRTSLEQGSRADIEFFVRFVALLLNDSTYLLNEALDKLQEIHQLQNQTASHPLPDQEGEAQQSRPQQEPQSEEPQTLEQQLSSAESQAKTYLHLSKGSMDLLGEFTRHAPAPFVAPEIVESMASMLNYNLDILAGDKRRRLVVRNPEKYGFNPKQLLASLSKIYVNLSRYHEFVVALHRDDRSYKASTMQAAFDVLQRHALLSLAGLKAWEDLVERAEKSRLEDLQDEENMGDVPEEFLDPVMYTIMKDPVTLPSSNVNIDRSTIKMHLLSDPIDPFTRAPLKIEEVVPNTELKSKISEFLAANRKKRTEVRLD